MGHWWIYCLVILLLGVWSGVMRWRSQSGASASGNAEKNIAAPQEESQGENEPQTEILPQKTDSVMLLVTGESGERINTRLCSRPSRLMRWESSEKDSEGNPVSVRIPEESTHSFPLPGAFKAAGKVYFSLSQLTAKKQDDGTFMDSHGRRVVYRAELYPCFDSYDRLYEDRHYRWWLIIESNRLTRVYREDDWDEVFVTEDVRALEKDCAEELIKYGLAVNEETDK